MTKPLIVIAALIAIFAGAWLGQTFDADKAPTKAPPIQGAIYPQAKSLNNFNLIDQFGHSITKANFIGHWSLIFIGYTHCPDVCPTTLAIMNQVSHLMKKQQLKPPSIIFLSIDPERDKVEVLKPYMAYFNKDFIGLTGSLAEITKFSSQLNAIFRKSAGSSGDITKDDYLMDHSSALMLLNPAGNLQSVLTAPHQAETIIDSITQSENYFNTINKE